MGQICKIHGCKNILNKTSGRICQMHRSRFHRHGDYEISRNWPNLKKGQPLVSPLGYMRININGKRVLQHRYVMEQHIGRTLSPSEKIHHVNGNKVDNRIENLELIKNQSLHMKNKHKDIWRIRTKRPPFSTEIINNILHRLDSPRKQFNSCYCGKKIRCRNLCKIHYRWAILHNFH